MGGRVNCCLKKYIAMAVMERGWGDEMLCEKYIAMVVMVWREGREIGMDYINWLA